MSNQIEISAIKISDVIKRVEEGGVRFYRQCLEKSNQFSTKFVIEKVLTKHREHVAKLSTLMEITSEEVISENRVEKLLRLSLKHTETSDIEVENLNFVEATMLAREIAEEHIQFYDMLLREPISDSARDVIKDIIRKKTEYLDQIKEDYERLRYKK